jgi:flagellar biosynthesis GTPase FlhF
MNPQQMLMGGFDSNYFLKDNAIYSDTELLQFPGMALLASRATKGKGKIGKLLKRKGKGSKAGQARSMAIPRIKSREAVNVLTGERLEQQEPELTRKQKRQSRRDKRREDRRATRRTRRMDRQEAKRKRQEQRQSMRLARAQARQDRKLAQTEARQQDNIIKAEARAGATESGQTFGQKVGDFFGQAGQGASQALKNLAQSQEFQDQFQDRTGIDPSFLLSDQQADITPPEESFFEKNKIPLLIAGGGLAIYLFTRKKK